MYYIVKMLTKKEIFKNILESREQIRKYCVKRIVYALVGC